uniref:AlNc14C633G12302 protein n=1 Tax=Albugo laibachii Nc14 TaxID=890382 RepID=F0X1J9_9STRA|nr:AlNc14C633G12302 [Albugo laibachii Nc14]|eukprot:CCA27689.1 AlNc14C633G12302 [Albugo laibachii Nc14]
MTIFGNKLAWWNESLHLRFLQHNFAQRSDMQKEVLLLLDDFSGHWSAKVQAYAKEINVVLLKVPPQFTSVCQPADVNWIKPFKEKKTGAVDWFFAPSALTQTRETEIERIQDEEPPETIKKGYHRAHMRTGNLEVAASELIDELERLYIMENEIGEIDSDDDFDRSIIHLCLVGGLSCVAMCLLPLVFLGS